MERIILHFIGSGGLAPYTSTSVHPYTRLDIHCIYTAYRVDIRFFFRKGGKRDGMVADAGWYVGGRIAGWVQGD